MGDQEPECDVAGTIALAAVLDLTAAEPLHRALLDSLYTAQALTLDGEAVERVSTAAVQVLLAAAAEAQARGIGFRLRAPSAALIAALDDLGVRDRIGR